MTDLVVSGIGTLLPPAEQSDVDWFDYKVELGDRGYKYVPRASQYLLAAAKRGLADAQLDLGEDGGARCGVALGSNNCASRLHATIDRTVLSGGVSSLRPATAPFFSVNLFLSRLAIEHKLKGFSLALHSPGIAGLEAFESGARAVTLGRASWLVLGVTEETLDDEEPANEGSNDGSVVFTVEPAADVKARGGKIYGSCAARTFYAPPSTVTTPEGKAKVASLVHNALDRLGATPDVAVRLIADDSPVSDALAAALPGATRELAGAGSLGPLVAVADVLRAGGPPTLVATSVATGNIALALVTPA